jgi:hypothetical protein
MDVAFLIAATVLAVTPGAGMAGTVITIEGAALGPPAVASAATAQVAMWA